MTIRWGLICCRRGDGVQTFTFGREFFISSFFSGLVGGAVSGALLGLVLLATSARATDFVIYDFDDTLMRLPTENYAFPFGEHGRLAEPRKLGFTSSELPLLRDEIGRPGTPLERFEIVGDDRDPLKGSFQNARPGRNGENPFDRDLALALELPQSEQRA